MKSVAREFLSPQFLRYAIIGVTGVAIDFILFLLLVKVGVPAVVASVISVSVAIVNNFILNAYLNFKKKDHIWWRFLSFYTVGATGVVLSALFIILFHNILEMDEVYAKLISVPFIVVFQYWFNKYASFAESHTQIPWRQLIIFCVSISVLTVFALNAPYYNFTDENDNLLGAQLIAQDQIIIFKDYFSHHMPLTYFVAAPLFAILGANLIGIKVVFGLLMGVWLLTISRHILLRFGMKMFIVFTGLIAISQTLTWSHMILAETLIGFALCHALILFITRDTNSRNRTIEAVTYALLGSIPLMSSLSYAPISLLIYGLWLWTIIENKKILKLSTLCIFILSAALPYLAFITYLYLTRSFSEFKEQAISFNTLYYSQYSPDAPTSIIDSLLSIIQGSSKSLQDSLMNFSLIAKQPLSFLFSVAVITSLTALIMARRWTIFIVFSVALFFAGSRSGFAATFANNDQARAGIILTIVGILLCCYTVFSLLSLKNNYNRSYRHYMIVIFAISFIALTTTSIGQLSTIARGYVDNKNTIKLNEEPGSPSTVINIVNDQDDYYWIGPIDFSSQIVTKSKNISQYRFYPPWVSACDVCSQELIADVRRHKPQVIALNTDMSIWGVEVKEYADSLINDFNDQYYQIKNDPRLKHFYFLKENKSNINAKLEKAGYTL